MTMYFPLVVHGAMLVEPTETESKAGLDQFIVRAALDRRAGAGRGREPQGRADLRAAPPARRDAGGAQAGARLQDAGARRRRGGGDGDGDGRWRLSAASTKAPADGARRSAPAALRNREPIAEVLARLASRERAWCSRSPAGRGEHAVHFARRFPGLEWQPSDVDPDALASIAAWRAAAGLANFRAPLVLDAAAPDWPIARADAVLSINMVHISPWASALGLLDGAARCLPPGGAADPLRPVAEGRHRHRAEQPRVRCRPQAPQSRLGPAPGRGFRRRRRERGLELNEHRAMPANNLMLLLRKR